MVKTNRAQREALARVTTRIRQDWATHPSNAENMHAAPTYRDVRRTVQPGPGCIMVPFAGMWLGIEPDGYTHS